eukprot:10380161-Ditylum_brightwellii.AAC.1
MILIQYFTKKQGSCRKLLNIGECIHTAMLWRSTRKRTPEKKAKDIASSETNPQGGSDVGADEADERAASEPGPERRKGKKA